MGCNPIRGGQVCVPMSNIQKNDELPLSGHLHEAHHMHSNFLGACAIAAAICTSLVAAALLRTHRIFSDHRRIKRNSSESQPFRGEWFPGQPGQERIALFDTADAEA